MKRNTELTYFKYRSSDGETEMLQTDQHQNITLANLTTEVQQSIEEAVKREGSAKITLIIEEKQ